MKIDSEEEAIFIAERKEWGVRSVSKLNRAIPSPLRTKRQHYSRFDTPRSIRFSMYYQYFEIV